MSRGPIADDEPGISLEPGQLSRASHLPAALVGDSPQLRAVLDKVAEVARTDVPVLLIGEHDTGKREIARMIHQMSRRADAPFQAFDCESQAGEVERTLQAHAGEADATPGEAGTLAIAELEALEAGLRERVIAALIEHAAASDVRGGVRLIVIFDSAPGEPEPGGELAARLTEALHGAVIRMPALRERRNDVPVLADLFVEAANRRFGRSVSARPLLAALKTYSWPGNLKELETRLSTYVTQAPPESDAEPQAPNAFAVPVDRIDVTLFLPDGTRHEARLPRGPGQPLEHLFEDKEPFLAVQEGGQTRIYARAALACIEARGIAPQEDEALPQRRRAVRVLLRGGATLEGELRYVPVEGRARVTDVLNEHSPSFCLHRKGIVQLVAKAHVLCVEEC